MASFGAQTSSLANGPGTTATSTAMHPLSSLALLGTYAAQIVLGRPNSHQTAARSVSDVDAFIAEQRPIAMSGLLRNIGPDGAYAPGVAPGVVVASPTTVNPDYYYTWTRDSALVFKCLGDILSTEYDPSLQHLIEYYITTQARLQGVDNPAGSLADGAGLGEAKFNVNLRPYKGSWGRPQRDGPALRAIAMMGYANWLLTNGYTSTIRDILWPVIRNDIAYVSQYWNQTGFDLWEEVHGSSFFTVASQHRALVEGSTLAKALGESCASCDRVAPQILCFLQSFWSPSGNYVVSNIHTDVKRTGLDANSLLVSIHNFDPAAGCDGLTLQPCSSRSLANHKAVVDSFRFYAINSGIPAGQGIAVGRYSEDVYYDGNPWYLATLAAAELLYDSVYTWKLYGAINVTETSLPFFQDLSSSVKTGSYTSGSATFTELVDAVRVYADGFVGVAAKYTPSNGSMAEQFHKNDGHPLSAGDLTWSYASFLTATDRRAGIVPASWWMGGGGLPASCGTDSEPGTYSSVSPPPFPPSQTPITGAPPTPTTTASTTATGCVVPVVVDVTFSVLVTTVPGETIKVVGDIEDLGKWNPENATPLDASAYTSSNPLWKTDVTLKGGHVVKYKYVKVQSNGSVSWEADPDRTYTVPHSCATEAAISDRWQ
ncbi:hypothetical protein RB597_006037 [Gaeumannomyces tritici]